jgi:diguanylate cyclase (GGDEF)-like protein
VHRIYSHEKIRDAEQDAVAVGHAIFMQEQHVLTKRDSGGRERIQVEPENFAGLDERMRKYLHPFNMFKIKVYSHDKTIVYSTDPSLIGKVDSGNARLERVLRFAEPDSKLQTKDRVADLAGETRFNVEVVETYLPITAGDAIIGSFEVYIDVTPARERVPKVLASSLAVLFSVLAVVFGGLFMVMRKGTLWLEQAQDKLRALAATDMLTGIFNRRYLMGRIQEEYSRMARERRTAVKHCLGFVMVDIDHFKTINDTYGHVVGDEILRQVSARLKDSLRAHDVIGRYGGEEFLATLPHTDLDEAKEVADRMRRAIRAASFDVGGAAVKVTVSAGVARSENGEDEMLPALRRADSNLYRAKSEGRDRVCV